MNIKRLAAVAAITATIGVTWAAPANASSDKIVGSNAASSFWFAQTTGDCVEASFDLIYGTIHGTRMHEATVIAEAQKLNVLGPNPANGSNWYGPDGIAKLGAHYGVAFTLGSHKISTIEADLAAGDHIIAQVNGETIWSAIPANLFPNPGAGMAWDFSDTTTPDHALVVDSIDETAGTITLTDTGQGMGRLETVSLATFSKAMAPGGYAYAVTSKSGK